MKFWEFFLFARRLEDKAIARAIADAEEKTSGEIRVFISRHPAPDPVAAAQKQFERLAMTQTRERNGVLIFLAPRSRTFALIGDTAIHEKCGDDFWKSAAARLSQALRAGRVTDGLCAAVEECGVVLAREFPRHDDDKNELPNAVERD